MNSVRLAPTKLILVGTRTTYRATGDAGVCYQVILRTKKHPEKSSFHSDSKQRNRGMKTKSSREVTKYYEIPYHGELITATHGV